MFLRHRIAVGSAALALVAVGLLTLPGAAGAAAADCSGAVGPSAAAARAFAVVDRQQERADALQFLQTRPFTTGAWSAEGDAVAMTAQAVAALREAEIADPSIELAQEWLFSLQAESGVLEGDGDDRRLTADALPALTGTDQGARAAAWLQEQLVAEGGDGQLDHFTSDGVYDFRLIADAVLGWDAVEVEPPGPALAAAWLGRHAVEYLEEEPGARTLARLVLVANASGQPADDFGPSGLNLVAELIDQQAENGRFAEDTATQALSLRALGMNRDAVDEATAGRSAEVLSAGADALLDQQCTGGGYPTDFGDPTQPTEQTPIPTPIPSSTVPGSPTSTFTPAPSTTVSLIPATSSSSAPTDGLVLDLDEITAGSPVSITVNGFDPFERVRIELHSTPIVLGYLQVDSRGSGTTVVSIPRNAAPGLHHIWVIGESSGIQFSRTVTITPEAPVAQVVVLPTTQRPSPDARLSATGASVSPASAGLAGGAILLAGVGLTVWSRRRTAAGHR